MINTLQQQKMELKLYLLAALLSKCAQPIKEEYLLNGFLEPTNEAYAIAKIAGLKMTKSYLKNMVLDAFHQCYVSLWRK